MKKLFTSFFILITYLSSLDFNAQVCYAPPFMTPTLGNMISPDMIINGDFNNDGNLDFAFTGSGTTLYLYLGDGLGGATSFSTLPSQGLGIMPADFNNDGNLDIVATATANVDLFLGNGSGGFSKSTFPLPCMSSGVTLETSDFNNDGNKDIVMDGVCGFSILLGNGLGAFTTITNTIVSGFTDEFACNDFNLDGNIDLAYSDGSNLYVLNGNGAGNFNSGSSYTGVYGNKATADFNMDGKPDLAMVFSQDIYVYFGNGLGGFGLPTIYPIGWNPWMVETKDLNGDGMPDLAVGRVVNDDIAVLINQGSGTFATPQIFYAGATFAGPQGLTLGDYNGDGINDIALADGGPIQSGISIFSSNGPTVTAISSSSLICAGQSVTLTAGGANTYLWLAISTATTIVVSPTVTTTYTVKGTIPGCVSYTTITQSVSLCQGVDQLSFQKGIRISPNPTKDQFNLQFSDIKQKTEIKIFNSLGQLILQKIISSTDKISLSISDQPSGIYFVELNADGESFRTKVVKE